MANDIRVRVGFDHDGADGERRKAGDEVTISYGEYLRRGPQGDGFVRELRGADGGRIGLVDPAREMDLAPGTSIPVSDPTGIGDSATSRTDERPAETPQAEQIAAGERRSAETRPAKATAAKRTTSK
jgi:hypothetical protein